MTISASQNRCISYGKQHILEMDHFGVLFTLKTWNSWNYEKCCKI